MRGAGVLSGRLKIEISESPERVTERLSNLKAPPEAHVEAVRFEPTIFVYFEGLYPDAPGVWWIGWGS